mmetsp:Transcript_35773/g.103108  ORF Transcript_35773/g.103108 Transcript_35773/m.103108 type:complete len:323 (-) Transcript_35773:278-1246(-)
MQGKVLPQLRHTAEHVELLLLSVRQDALGHTRDGAEHIGDVADVELVDAANVVVAHDAVDLAERPQRHLADTQTLHVDDDAEVLDLPRHDHVPCEVLHAEDQHADEPAHTLVGVPLLRDARSSDHDRWAHAGVAAGEVHDAMLHILGDLFAGDRPFLEVFSAPLLRGLHEFHGLLRVHPRPAQEARRHCGHRGVELGADGLGFLAHLREAVQLGFGELDVEVDFALAVTVLELRHNGLRRRRVSPDLARQREGRDEVLPAGQRGDLGDRLEAVRTARLHHARRQRPGRPIATLRRRARRGALAGIRGGERHGRRLPLRRRRR